MDLILVIVREGQDTKTYVVSDSIVSAIIEDERVNGAIYNCRLFMYVTRHGAVGLWPVKIPLGEGQELNEWSESALRVIDQAKSEWIRHQRKNSKTTGYITITADMPEVMGEPAWPKESFEEILELAFGDKIIEDLEHPVFKTLRGSL